MELELIQWFFQSIKDFGFPVVCCGVLYFDMRTQIKTLTDKISLILEQKK